MAVFDDQGDFRSIVCADFSLIFERLGDRWTHAIAVSVAPDQPREIVARAIEWDLDRDDAKRVVSPVFQELFLQTDPKGVLQGLCVGMSGKHHFSAVFAVEESPQGVILSIDIADRVRDDVLAFASSYAVLLTSSDLEDCDDTFAAWHLSAGLLTCRVERPGLLGLAEAGRRATRIQATADPESPSTDPTRRWRYLWNWQRDSVKSSLRVSRSC